MYLYVLFLKYLWNAQKRHYPHFGNLEKHCNIQTYCLTIKNMLLHNQEHTIEDDVLLVHVEAS